MNSEVIKVVAGGGKTTDSEKYMSTSKNGLYLAFNNSVVEEMSGKGFLCKTIDSFFASFVIPKMTSIIPLIASGSEVKYVDSNMLPKRLKGILRINIDEDGNIYNQSQKTVISMNLNNTELHKKTDFKNEYFIKNIFGKNRLLLSNQHRKGIADYIIKNYPEELLDIIESRFDYIIIDEAQDLKSYMEKFAELLFSSNIKLIVFGDENQNINNGGPWFESKSPTIVKNVSHRCTEEVCCWIRENLGIEIYGQIREGSYNKITKDEIKDLDNNNTTLLYSGRRGWVADVVDNWKGPKKTIQSAKGSTIIYDIVIIGNNLKKRYLYTAITRTKKSAFSTVEKYT